jgi:hypothetical protein
MSRETGSVAAALTDFFSSSLDTFSAVELADLDVAGGLDLDEELDLFELGPDLESDFVSEFVLDVSDGEG